MKIKKILAAVVAMAISATTFSSVAMAEDAKYGTPKVTINFVQSGNYLDAEIGYTGFEGFAKYESGRTGTTGIGLESITIKLEYDEGKVTYDGGQVHISVGTSEVVGAGKNPAGAGGTYAGQSMQSSVSNNKMATLWFTLKDGVDLEKEQIEFKVSEVEFVVTDVSTGQSQIYGTTSASTVPVELETFTVGTAATEPDPELPELVENQYVFSFDADEETDIKIINSRTGDKTYDLPDFVKGTMKVWGLLKFSGNEDVQAGDTFTIKTAKNRVELETIKTITVQAADLQ